MPGPTAGYMPRRKRRRRKGIRTARATMYKPKESRMANNKRFIRQALKRARNS